MIERQNAFDFEFIFGLFVDEYWSTTQQQMRNICKLSKFVNEK